MTRPSLLLLATTTAAWWWLLLSHPLHFLALVLSLPVVAQVWCWREGEERVPRMWIKR